MVAPDLPYGDTTGLSEHADAAVDALDGVLARTATRTGLIMVSQSMAGFTASLVCERVPVEILALVAATLPAPGESPSQSGSPPPTTASTAGR